MTRMTRPDCAVMRNLINTHTHTHTRMFWAERRGGFAPVGPRVDTATIRIVLAQIAWAREVFARDAVRFGVNTQAQTLLGYLVSE